MNNIEFGFCFGAAILTVFCGLIVYLACNAIAEYHGNSGAMWPFLVAAAFGIVSIVLWVLFALPLFEPVCANGHRNNMGADYCIVCGVDLLPSCDCGHVWNDEQSYCPDCGKPRG